MENCRCLSGSRYKIDKFFGVLFLVDRLINWPNGGTGFGHVHMDVREVG